jgi:hypothetical protein
MSTEVENIDAYSADEEIPEDDALASIAALAEEQVELEEDIATAEAALKSLNAAYRDIAESKLPQAMAEVGLREFTLENGKKVKVTDDWKASITGKKKSTVVEWLRENGHDDIIKTTVITEFNKGEDDKAVALVESLTENGYISRDDVSVNTGTFKSLCKELVAEGVDLPLGELGIYIVRKSVIK